MKAHRFSVRIALILALVAPFPGYSQQKELDYGKLRRTLITRTCGTKSREEVMANQAALARIDPEQIRKGLDLFHYDGAMLAYTRFGLTGDTLWLDQAIQSFQYAAKANQALYPAYQGEAICLYLRGDCTAAVSAVQAYKSTAPKKHQKDTSLDNIVTACQSR